MFFLVNVYGVCQGICGRYTCEKSPACKLQRAEFETKISWLSCSKPSLQLKLNLFLITQAWTKIIHLEKTMLELKNVSYNKNFTLMVFTFLGLPHCCNILLHMVCTLMCKTPLTTTTKMKQPRKDKKMARLRIHGNISKKSNDNFQYTVKAYSLNPLNPKSAKYLISPYNITPESHI